MFPFSNLYCALVQLFSYLFADFLECDGSLLPESTQIRFLKENQLFLSVYKISISLSKYK